MANKSDLKLSSDLKQRSSDEEIQFESRFFLSSEKFASFSFMPDILLVINQNRQIVFANKTLLQMLNVESVSSICGMRPGELFQCTHAGEGTGGCGTAVCCQECGALQAVLEAMKTNLETIKECRIMLKSGDGMDLRVWASPIEEQGRQYVVVAMKDIEDEKRRQMLEKIFFHDILNTAGAVKSTSELLVSKAASSDDMTGELADMIYSATDILIDEIKGQKVLVDAENKVLKPKYSSIQSMTILHKVKHLYENNTIFAADKTILIDPTAENMEVITDVTLLLRVVGNMLKNALEASKESDIIMLNCSKDDGQVLFSVQNPAYIIPEIQHQIFKRSFSTKGLGRGLGTYSIKLLTERGLGGKAGFSSSKEEGTTFFVRLPLCASSQKITD